MSNGIVGLFWGTNLDPSGFLFVSSEKGYGF